MNKKQSFSIECLEQLLVLNLKNNPLGRAYRWRSDGRWKSMNWFEASQKVSKIRRVLSAQVPAGGRILLLLKNSPEWVCIAQAAIAEGVQLVTLPSHTSHEKIAYVARQTRPAMLFFDDSSNVLRDSLPSSVLSECVLISLCKRRETENVQGFSEWLLTSPSTEKNIRTSVNAGETAFIVFTSGTTGRPKGVHISHRHILHNLTQIQEHVCVTEADRFYCVQELSYIFELVATLFLAMKVGATVIFSEKDRPFEGMAQHRPTILNGTPSVYSSYVRNLLDAKKRFGLFGRIAFFFTWQALMLSERTRKWNGLLLLPVLLTPVFRVLLRMFLKTIDGGCLRLKVLGGASVSPFLIRSVLASGGDMLFGYGLSEAGPLVCINSHVKDRVGLASPISGVEWMLADNGELLLRGDSVARHYLDGQNIQRDGWFHTGDIFRRRNEQLYFCGRTDNLIQLSTGECLNPEILENQIGEDALIDHVIITGHGQSQAIALMFVDTHKLKSLCHGRTDKRLYEFFLTRIRLCLKRLPHAWEVTRFLLLDSRQVSAEWIDAKGRIRRDVVIEFYQSDISRLYRSPSLHAIKAIGV